MLNRRDFIAAIGTISGAATMATHLNAFAQPIKQTNTAAGFQTMIFATNWGYEGSWGQFCTKIKNLGYDGAEAWYPANEQQRKEFLTAFDKHGLKFGLLVGGSDRDYQKHLNQFKTSLDGAVSLKPVYINCHSGRDHFSFEQNRTFIDITTTATERTGIPVYHETHRSRILYAAPIARQYLEKIPSLRLTLDISHWCNVHESLLEDQAETVLMALKKTGHIHARVGHQQGPQVNDPRAPEWKNAVTAHFAWWDKIIEQKREEGKLITFLTEFGPADYMPALPYTRQPVADQWEINKHMLDTLRVRYA